MIPNTIEAAVLMFALVAKRERHAAVLARISERAKYARIVAANWDKDIDVNARIKVEA